MAARARAHVADHDGRHLGEVGPLPVQLDVVQPQARGVEDLLDEPGEPIDLADDDLEPRLGFAAAQEELRVGLDYREGGLELVGGRREQLLARLGEPVRARSCRG